jgi:hypothetical protein
VQLFGLNYRGIIDPTDLEWYTAILEECKSLNINDFLHDVNPYVVTRTLPLQRAASSNVSDSNCPAAVPRRRLVEMDIFGSEETARERSSAPRQDTPNLDTFLGEGSREFNQFGTMRGEMHRVEDTSPSIQWDRVLAKAGNPVVTRSPDCNHFLSRRRLRIARLQELRCRSTAMKLEVLLKVARPDDHPLLLGPAIHLRISLVEPHLSLPLIIRRMMTIQVMSSPRRLCPTPLRWRWIIS